MSSIRFIQENKTLKEQEVFKGGMLRVFSNKIQLPNGIQVQRELVHHLPSVAILAINEKQQVCLVKQYRPAVASDMLEIPAGLIDQIEGQLEEPICAAKRELEEETSYQAKTWVKGPSFYVSPGFLDEKIYLFFAKNLKLVEDALSQDDDEDVSCEWYDREQIETMLEQGEIQDLKTLFALQIFLGTGGYHGVI